MSAQYDDVVPGLTLVTLPKGVSAAEAAMKFAASPDVRYAEPNYRYQLSRTPNDPSFKDQWALNNTGQTNGLADADIDAPEAWDVTTGNKDLIVAVLDTGIDATHPDLKNIWSNRREATGKADTDDDNNGYIDDVSGYNFLAKSKNVADDVYHGTYVAGIIGASTNNGVGVAGVSWNVSLMICKVANKDGVNLDAAVAAVQYATAMGAKIINASWGGPEYSKSLRDAIEAAGKKGILFVAAAGNGSVNTDNTPFYPAAYPLYNVVSVMATNSRDQMALTSNYGVRSVDLAEPGEGVLSTMPVTATDVMTSAGLTAEYGVLSGTSVAAPHVSGAAALLWAKYPALSYHQVKQVLMQTADKVVPGLCQSHGRVNVAKALAAVPGGTLGRVINTRDDYTDPNNYYYSIQEAIDDANNGDTLIAEGRRTGNTLFLEMIDFKGKAITLRSGDIANPSDPNLYTSSAIIFGLAKQGSLVTFANGEGRDSVIQGFTIGWGVAENGGGIRIENASPTITDCIIANNHARSFGGGIDCLGGSPLIRNCVISDNVVFDAAGVGGGLNFEDATPTVADCIIRNNRSMSSGGGIAFLNGSASITNCFILNNSAVGGGGQIDLVASSPTITNCTIVVDDATPSRDGGVWAFDGSDPQITNCILWGNGDDLFNCTATYSCIEDTEDGGEGDFHANPMFTQGPDGAYYLSQIAAGQLVHSPCVDAGVSDIDPSLAAQMAGMTTRTDGEKDVGRIDVGAHYAAASAANYPLIVTVVDAGGNPVDPNVAGGVVTVAPSTGSVRRFEVVTIKAEPKDGWRIKRWVGTPDDTKKDPTVTFVANGPVAIQVEFEQIPLFRLVTRVQGQYPVAGSTETCKIQPEHRRGQLYREGTVVALTAVPVGPYIIDHWTGTDNDATWALLNTVTMTSDKEVTVSFTQPRTLEVPGQFPSIAAAISAARTHGDTIIVKRGTYRLNGTLDFNGKAITLTSDNPDDPACVASTVLDCRGQGRAFKFHKGEGADSVIDGFTIQNGNGHEWGASAPTGDTGDAGADALGGAVACFNGSSPTLSNLIIRNCTATGFAGAPGTFVHPAPQAQPEPDDPAAAPDQEEAPAPPDETADPNADGTPGKPGADGAAGLAGADGVAGADGYNGGKGGNGYGGAFYFDANSAPTILHCTISDCSATGGAGGAGGAGQAGQNGQNGQDGQDGQQGQDGGDAAGEGTPGAGGNGGAGGAGGNGGAGGAGGKGGDGGDGGDGLGGAMYFGPNCRPIIKYCTIQNTTVRQGLGAAAGPGGAGGAGGN
ncbi:MAG: S8 family serine peptidase, partial [Planctomycetes bacterium]|nr:S8 family serine peptidase [Planctomycetota bacterium]